MFLRWFEAKTYKARVDFALILASFLEYVAHNL